MMSTENARNMYSFIAINLVISASGWLFKNKSVTMNGNMDVKFVNAKQAKEIYQCRNTRDKLYKTNAAVWYNKVC